MGDNSTTPTVTMGDNSTSNNSTYSQLEHVSDIANTVFISLCMPFIMVGNILVIVSVAKFRQLQTTMNIFVTNLAVADLLVGFPTVPLYIWFFMDGDVRVMKYPCLLKYVCVLIALPTSALSLMMVTVDRFIAIIFPFQYPLWMTKTQAKIMIAGVWVYAISTATLPLYGVHRWRAGEGCSFWGVLPEALTIPTVPVMQCIALSSTFLLYLKIFKVARGNKKRINSFKTKGTYDEKKMKRDTKNAKVMALVFCLFLLFWMPLFSTAVLKYTSLPQRVIEMIKTCAVSLAMSNSLVNPIIYCWIRQDFRTAFKKLTCFRVTLAAMEGLFRPQSQTKNETSNRSSMVGSSDTVNVKF